MNNTSDLILSYAGRGAVKVHGGFYNGAKRHLAEIAGVVKACDERAGQRLPVWVTGHSLGGGYANALALHLLAQRNTAELFGAGVAALPLECSGFLLEHHFMLMSEREI